MTHDFHANCGSNLDLSRDARTLTKIERRRKTKSVALTRQPLHAGEAFLVKLEDALTHTDSDDTGLEIGVTSLHPDTLEMPRTMTNISQGMTYMVYKHYIVSNQQAIDVVGDSWNSKDVKVGDVLGVRFGNLGILSFLHNDRVIATVMPSEEVTMWFGVIDLYGTATQVSIIPDPSFDPAGMLPGASYYPASTLPGSAFPTGSYALPRTPVSTGSDVLSREPVPTGSDALSGALVRTGSDGSGALVPTGSDGSGALVPTGSDGSGSLEPFVRSIPLPSPLPSIEKDLDDAFPPSPSKPSATTPSATAPSPSTPSGMALSASTPSGMAPSASTPSGMAPSGMAPSGMAPSGMASAAMAPSASTSSSSTGLQSKISADSSTPSFLSDPASPNPSEPPSPASPPTHAPRSSYLPSAATPPVLPCTATPPVNPILTGSLNLLESTTTIDGASGTFGGSFSSIRDASFMKSSTAKEAAREEDIKKLEQAIIDVAQLMSEPSTQTMDRVHTRVKKIKSYVEKRKALRSHLGNLFLKHNGLPTMHSYIIFMKRNFKDDKKAMEVNSMIQRMLYWCINEDSTRQMSIAVGNNGLLALSLTELQGRTDTEYHRQMAATALMLIYAAARDKENVVILRTIGFIDAALVCLATGHFKPDIVIATQITMSYVMEENETCKVQLSPETCGKMIGWLQAAVENGKHTAHGWRADELCDGLANLAGNENNVNLVIERNGHAYFTKLVQNAKHDRERSAGLRALKAHLNHLTYKRLLQVENLLDVVQKAGEDGSDAIKSLVSDFLHEMDRYQGKKSSPLIDRGCAVAVPAVPGTHDKGRALSSPSGAGGEEEPCLKKTACSYKLLCQEFCKHLGLRSEYFLPSNNRCFCYNCHRARGVKDYQKRGQPKAQYTLPISWCRIGLALPPKYVPMKVDEVWHKAFHGTKQKHLDKILSVGELAMPGVALLGGSQLYERSVHLAGGKLCLERGSGKKIFMSPSIHYAGNQAYATPEIYISPSGETYNAKVVIEVFVDPASYTVGPQTIGLTENIDREIGNDVIEWSTEAMGSTVLYGLLVHLEKVKRVKKR